MGVLENNLISGLLLAVLSFVLAMSILVVYLVIRLRQRDAALAQFEPTPEPDVFPRLFAAHRHVAFKRPACWLAIRNRHVHAVQSALALHDVRPCSWADGLANGPDQKLFISPPFSGWILVMGSALPDPCEDEDASFRFLQQLSRKLGHVQLFSVSEVFNQHAWVRAEMGRILRAYAWSGRTLWNQGQMTGAERELGLKCYDYAQSTDCPSFGLHETGAGNSDKVHLLAARWSLDPDEIDERFLERARGIVGEPARHF
jgi:hypothetical protein